MKEPFQLELAFQSYHQLSIRGLDIAIQKPLFVSSGDDHTVRLWNYETNSIEQMKVYAEPIYAISMHPSGHQMVVAFASKVCIMNILIDGFSTLKEFPIHAAHEIKYRYFSIFFFSKF
jgi:WD40 repeat protein